MMGMPLVVLTTWLVFTSVETRFSPPTQALPPEPPEHTRIEEIFDQESRLLLSLYSLKGNGTVDYVTGRTVEQHVRSSYGNPVYYTVEFPIFYWWNHTMWNDPLVDGVNGNELVYQEDTDFDVSRYKPCVFNGQPC
jgi:hypothetical protein